MNDAGGGHRRLSEALAWGVEKVAGACAIVRIEDIFALNPRTLAYRLGRLYGPTIRIAPALYGLLYHATNTPSRARQIVRQTQKPLQGPARRLIRQFDPDIIITTHPLVNRLVLDALAAEGRATPVLAQVSELVSVHASWVEPRLTAYAVATEEARQAILRHGAPPERIRVLGLPIGPAFATPRRVPPAEVRAHLGLDPERFTVLAVGGSEGAGGLRMAVGALIKSGLDLQLIVVCGRNTALKRRLSALTAPFPMRVLGFVDTIAEFMSAADVVLTKGGPQTLVEAFSLGKPVLVTRPLPGQEEGNEQLVERHGAGYHVPTAPQVVAAVARLSQDNGLRRAMGSAAARLARPQAAVSVARWALALARHDGQDEIGAPLG